MKPNRYRLEDIQCCDNRKKGTVEVVELPVDEETEAIDRSNED